MDVLQLHTHEPDPDVVRHLRRLLAEAEAGELRAVIYLAEQNDGHYQSAYFGAWNDTAALLGRIWRMGHRVNLSMDQLATYEDK
jgi:hypothetical protein